MTTNTQEMRFTANHAGFTYGHCDKCRQAPATHYAPAEDGTERSLCEFCANEDYPGEIPLAYDQVLGKPQVDR